MQCFYTSIRRLFPPKLGLLTLSTTKMMNRNGYSTEMSPDNIIWIDMEMTGLNPKTCHILEVACLITDKKLNITARGPELIIHQPKEILENMEPWPMEHLTKSGLVEASLKSMVSVSDAENQLLDFVTKYTPPGKCPLGGSSVYMDKLFMMKYFPRLCNHLHYRLIDVSTVKELCTDSLDFQYIHHMFDRRWYPSVVNDAYRQKRFSHRAMADIEDSINELKLYKDQIFR